MQQLEIKFFWPLTEQIPLDLNYDECEKLKLSVPINAGQNNFVFTSNGTVGSFISASHLTLDIDTTVIKVKEEPNWSRKVLFKCLGLKWEKKC